MEPLSAIALGAQILNLVTNVFGAHGPSAAEIAAQQAAAAAAARQKTYLTVGIAGVAVLAVFLLLERD